MKKLYLLLDEWDNDRNFVGGELRLIAQKYDVTVICNSAASDKEPGVRYLIYTRPSKVMAVLSLLKGVADKDLFRELKTALRYRSDVSSNAFSRLSEALRFYINADLFRRFLKQKGCFENDAVYYSYWNFWKCYAVTHDIDRYPDSRIVSRIHGYELYDEQIPSGYQPFKAAMDSKLNRLVFVSETGREHYLRKFNRHDSEKYGLYLLGTPNSLMDEEILKGVFREASDEFVIVSCSRIDMIKRVGHIVDALSLIEGIRIRWVHFGSGILEAEVKERAHRLLDGHDNISYVFKGAVDNREIHSFYRKHQPDVFINVSSSEGNPVSVMEALSYGIPVIAPAICNFPNMIKDCGILVSDKCSADELAEAIRKIAGMDFEEINALRTHARKCWDEKFNADKNNRRFVEEVLDKL